MGQLRKQADHSEAGSGQWMHDPMARLLFKAGPPAPARSGRLPPIPFASLEEMRDAWRAACTELLPALRAELGGDEPWAEREWHDA